MDKKTLVNIIDILIKKNLEIMLPEMVESILSKKMGSGMNRVGVQQNPNINRHVDTMNESYGQFGNNKPIQTPQANPVQKRIKQQDVVANILQQTAVDMRREGVVGMYNADDSSAHRYATPASNYVDPMQYVDDDSSFSGVDFNSMYNNRVAR